MHAQNRASVLPDLVSTEWLGTALRQDSVKILDARWFMPGTATSGIEAFRHSHIRSARFFDVDAISDAADPLPHMLPPRPAFERAMGALGITEDSTVVVYDGDGLFSAPRAWWTLRRFGHTRVAVLDGGLRKWAEEGRDLTTGEDDPKPVRYRATSVDALVVDAAAVQAGLAAGTLQVVDARTAGRFEGLQPEPRPGVRSGHIPGSLNVPHANVLDSATGRLLPREQLLRVFAGAGVDPARAIVCSCGSGVTACVIAFALAQVGQRSAAVYDGSWAEWGSNPLLPLATGHA